MAGCKLAALLLGRPSWKEQRGSEWRYEGPLLKIVICSQDRRSRSDRGSVRHWIIGLIAIDASVTVNSDQLVTVLCNGLWQPISCVNRHSVDRIDSHSSGAGLHPASSMDQLVHCGNPPSTGEGATRAGKMSRKRSDRSRLIEQGV
jgi:hypothetical protein